MTAPEPLPRWPEPQALSVAGVSQPRASARAKVTGQAVYASDVAKPGLLHAVLVRAGIARGEVTSFDASRARAAEGVVLVLGPFDLPAPPGLGDPMAMPRSWRVISPQVRFVGEEIGVVVATTEAAARDALRLIEIGYRREAACITVEQSLADGAPLLSPHGNLAGEAEWVVRGDFEAAQAAAEVVIEAQYSTSAQHHNPLEPHGCVAAWQGDALTLWDSNQGAHAIRERLAGVMCWPLDKVRVISQYVGGGFGSKIHLKPYHVIAAEAARRLQQPVRLFMGRSEEFIASHQRAPTWRRIRLGATRAGRLSFIDESVTGQAGPSALFGVIAAGVSNGLRLHRADAVRADLRRVLTNTQAPVPFRGPTAAEDIFCLEQAVDELAHALQIDPLALRLRNLAETDLLAGLPYAGKELARCYRLGAEAFGWVWRAPSSARSGNLARGVGMGAAAYDGTLYEASPVEIVCLPSGRIELRIGITEIGCGADTVFAQIAAEELGLPLALIDTHFGDTHTTPRSIDATNHSRTTTVVGPAVRAAAHALRSALMEAGANLAAPAVQQQLARAAGTEGLVRRAERERGPDGVFPAMFAAHFVEVEVDCDTGRVSVLRAVCAHDAGRVINPRLAAGQVQGGFLQGMGMALQEERVLDPRTGRMLNAAMWAYRTPSIVDAPASIRFIDAGRPDGGNSLGIKGIGEPPLIAAGAAIANAVHNAIGVRLRAYPITPEKVLAALQESVENTP